jgi:hypothetical protein
MATLETFTIATFAAHQGEIFRIHPALETTLTAELIAVTRLGGGSDGDRTQGGRRAPFSLIFRGPAGNPLPQRIYEMEHDAIGVFPLFLVPIGPDQEGMLYEAIFT